ncbi:hypothetical protein DUNSADRAFT_15259 [Dunaliella salina]|uniref:Peptidase S9 prolyl oligopeptidase catalytic domain-containing protein n=1 Tax=Dunaliella salina TaxID=3046 RepID=A0ABQ7H206_DUNSA|nr:hypothetical protein DUNSADRAFT_15259 [Dunaliella salina]|eukprot:KAF5840891.1 hypothetical protein DUNSADRAFT_15259 [Dunaliella salina]
MFTFGPWQRPDVVPGAAPVTAHMSVKATTGSYKATGTSDKGPALNDASLFGGPTKDPSARAHLGQRVLQSKIGCPAAFRVHGALDNFKLVLWESLAAIATVVRTLRLLLVGISDVIRGSLGLPAAYVAIVAPASAVAARLQEPWGVLRTPLSLGVLTDKDYAQMMAAVPTPPLGKWQNLGAARMLFSYPFYRPLKDAAGLTCPILMVAGRHDLITPEHSIRRAARILARAVGEQNVTVVALDGTHISLYKSPMLLPTMLDFLAHRVPLVV